MNCNFNYSNSCKCCTHFAKSIKIVGDEKELTVTIPETSLCNRKTVCICFAQDIPEESKKDSVLSISVGDDIYSVITPCGNFIYADQVRSGKVYCFKFGTDTEAFVYCGGWRLCRTDHIFDCIPIPAKAKRKIVSKNSKAEE